jgi:hypothetical protein
MANSTFAKIVPSDDRGTERWRIPAAPRASRSERSLNSRDSNVGRHAWLFTRSSEFGPPARESMTAREPGGVRFIKIEVSGIGPLNRYVPQNPNACLERSTPITRSLMKWSREITYDCSLSVIRSPDNTIVYF